MQNLSGGFNSIPNNLSEFSTMTKKNSALSDKNLQNTQSNPINNNNDIEPQSVLENNVQTNNNQNYQEQNSQIVQNLPDLTKEEFNQLTPEQQNQYITLKAQEQGINPQIINQQQTSSQTNATNKSGIVKKAVVAGIALAAIGGSGYLIYNHKAQQKAKEILTSSANKISGNNDLISNANQKQINEIEQMINDKPEIYSNIKDIITQNTHEFNFKTLSEDGLFYHATTRNNAKKILNNGISPFGSKVTKRNLELGQGIYGSFSTQEAELFSNDKVVLPFNLNSNNVVKLDTDNPNKFRELIKQQLMEYIDPTTAENSLMGSIRTSYSPRAVQFADDNVDMIINKAMKELGISAMVSEVQQKTNKVKNLFKKTEDKIPPIRTIAIYDGTNVTINTSKMKEMSQAPKFSLFNKAKKPNKTV